MFFKLSLPCGEQMKNILLTVASTLALSACAVQHQDPVVSSYNGDSVTIIQPAFTTMTAAQLLAKANDICGRGSKKFAERVSGRQLPDYQGTEFLFLCLAKSR
tara:strand:- start:588 stop:896 length:309 start_codon:yes stop_codon:yes gene_type:complete